MPQVRQELIIKGHGKESIALCYTEQTLETFKWGRKLVLRKITQDRSAERPPPRVTPTNLRLKFQRPHDSDRSAAADYNTSAKQSVTNTSSMFICFTRIEQWHIIHESPQPPVRGLSSTRSNFPPRPGDSNRGKRVESRRRSEGPRYQLEAQRIFDSVTRNIQRLQQDARAGEARAARKTCSESEPHAKPNSTILTRNADRKIHHAGKGCATN